MSQAEQSIRSNLETALPKDAVDYLCDLFFVIQVFDDFADGDDVARQDIDRALWALLVKIPQNPFYIRNSLQLTALHATQILKWQASDKLERAGNPGHGPYVWRAGYYDVVLFVASLCMPREAAQEVAADILGLYGESYDDYMAEFE